MNKLAQYLNQHLLGEVITDASVLAKMSHDGSPLKSQPEITVYPRNTNDIRKLARFSWQLAEKGHTLSLTPRGAGTDKTGGAIGDGVIINLTAHMNSIFEYEPKQRLVRVQPGVSTESVSNALSLQGMTVGGIDHSDASTVGGVISGSRNVLDDESWIDQMEVVLANGDVLQTKRLSKKELNRKKGEQTFEAEIYRTIDNLIADNKDLIEGLDGTDVAGYAGVKYVKRRDGSFDLSPLFFGSQGTLGIISELILKTESLPSDRSIVVASFDDISRSRDALDEIHKLSPVNVTYYDQSVLSAATKSGRVLFGQDGTVPKVLITAEVEDGSSRGRAKRAKKLAKLFEQFGGSATVSELNSDTDAASLHAVASNAYYSVEGHETTVSLLDGVYVPIAQLDEFSNGLKEIALKRRVEITLHGQPLEGMWYIRPVLDLHSVGGKQAVFKLIDDITKLVTSLEGHVAGYNGEGRLQSVSAHSALSDELSSLYQKIRDTFDPKRTLNPGVKEPGDLQKLVKSLRTDYVSGFHDGLIR